MDERRQKLNLEPPVELRSSPDEIWETLKVPYGCTDAPRAWYFTFAKWLCDQGGHALPNDMCIYTFYEHGVLVDTEGRVCTWGQSRRGALGHGSSVKSDRVSAANRVCCT